MTKTLRSLSVAVAIAALFSGCESSSPGAASSGTGPAGSSQTKALALVAGTWTFSHTGLPSIQNDMQEQLTETVHKNLKDWRIRIEKDGTASMIASGQAGSFTLEVVEETPLYIKVGVPEESDKTYTYDRRTKLLSIPIDIDVNGSKGTMAAYFKR